MPQTTLEVLKRIEEQIKNNQMPSIEDLVYLLDLEDFQPIYQLADQVRQQQKGNVVQIRAIVEFSNQCRRSCSYCGLNNANTEAPRYRMTPAEIIDTAIAAAEAGYQTLVMQSGEDPYYTAALLGNIVSTIKKVTNMAVTLSCGERSQSDYRHWKQCGADRYLLKHETADPELYAKLHPCGTLAERIACLRMVKKLGYETGSGFMIGLPGQTSHTIAKDLLLLKEISCDMAGIGPFIAHPATPLAGLPSGNTETTTRAVALARLLLPQANLPATTSLGVIDNEAKNHVFSTGANVVMKKVTPQQYKVLYEIYPANLAETNVIEERRTLEEQIRALGRVPV